MPRSVATLSQDHGDHGEIAAQNSHQTQNWGQTIIKPISTSLQLRFTNGHQAQEKALNVISRNVNRNRHETPLRTQEDAVIF